MRRGLNIVTILTVSTALVAAVLVTRRTEGWCDAVSGSKKWQTSWPLGITTGNRLETSALARRLHAIGYQWTPDWRCVHSTTETLLGGRQIDCSTAPPIYPVLCVLDSYAKGASPAELRKFAKTMQHGSEQDQKAAANAAAEKGLALLAADRTVG